MENKDNSICAEGGWIIVLRKMIWTKGWWHWWYVIGCVDGCSLEVNRNENDDEVDAGVTEVVKK